jgi:hypothetical protein
MTTRDPKEKLNEAFKLMRQAGLIAKQNFMCCGNCAGYSIATGLEKMTEARRSAVKGVCTYNRQDAATLARHGECYLQYGSIYSSKYGDVGLSTLEVGRMVVGCLTRAGLAYEWDEDPSKRITVKL